MVRSGTGGIPSMTIARYGITLNSTATDIIDNYELARIGYYKEENFWLWRRQIWKIITGNTCRVVFGT